MCVASSLRSSFLPSRTCFRLRICHCLFCCLVCNFLVLYCPSKYIYVHFITVALPVLPLQSVFIAELLCVLSVLCCPTVRWPLLMSISKKDQICWFSGFSFFTFLCDALGVLPLLHSLIVDVSVPVLDGVTFLPDLNVSRRAVRRAVSWPGVLRSVSFVLFVFVCPSSA